mgnify:CR=1 FL=1|jgi:hypothetical protein
MIVSFVFTYLKVLILFAHLRVLLYKKIIIEIMPSQAIVIISLRAWKAI